MYLIILVFLFGCDSITPVKDVNPYDPQSPYFIGNDVSNMSVKTLGTQKINVQWRDNSNYEKGYMIEKENIESGDKELFLIDKNQSQLIDTNLNIMDTYKYRIATKTNTPYYHYSDSIAIKFAPYQKAYHNVPFDIVADISGNSKRVVTYGINGNFNIYNLNDSLVFYRSFTSAPNSKVSISYDGRYIAFSRSDEVGYYDIDNDNTILLRKSSLLGSISSCIRGDDRYLVELTDSRSIIIWDLINNTQKSFGIEFSEMFTDVGISPDGKYIIGRSPSHTCLWSFDSFNLYASFNHGPGYNLYTFNNNSTLYIYTDDLTKEIYFWDVSSKEIVSKISSEYSVNSIQLILNGKFLALANSNDIILWELNNYKPVVKYIAFISNDSFLCKIARSGDFLISSNYLMEFPLGLLAKYQDNWEVINSN